MRLFRKFYEFFGFGAADGADEVGGEFFTFDGENTVVTGVFLHGDCSLCAAITAKTGEGQLAALDLAAGAISAEFCGNRDLMHIHDGIAVVADEVDVGFDVGIESFDTAHCGDAGDAALLLKESQVAINGCLRDVGMGVLKHLVYHLGGWVGVCVHQAGQDRIAFSEVLGVMFHRHRPFLYLRVILIYKRIISYLFSFVNKNYSYLEIIFSGSAVERGRA